MKKKIFLTNDDGIYAAGLSAIESVLDSKEFSYLTVAPLYEKSGASHSITLEKPLRVKKFNENKYGVDGTPVDSVFVGLNKFATEKPDLVISGINKGANLGNDMAYSGTVAAAVEAWSKGITSIAVSLHITDPSNFSDSLFLKTAELFFSLVLPEIERKTGKSDLYGKSHLFNINIPDFILDDKKTEMKWTVPGKRHYGGEVIS
ncbi:MAG TPA: 5'/3'-nucleotidase SurE, partial [bacterium]|nr:5'/3'-nucleotidase SurE [bacterium]